MKFKYNNVNCYNEVKNEIAPWLKGYNLHFVTRLLDEIYAVQGSSFFKYEYIICIPYAATNPVMPEHSKDRRILIYLGDEVSQLDKRIFQFYLYVFKQYFDFETNNNIFPLPLSSMKIIKGLHVKEINDRRINIFFSGNLNANRVELYNVLNGIHYTPSHFLLKRIYCRFLKSKTPIDCSHKFNQSCIRFTEGFAKGFALDEYIEKLQDSKIVICPGGFVSNETIRHFEAMQAGCIIISDKLPDTYLYKDSPIIILSKWNRLKSVVNELLQSPDEMSRIQKKMVAWWREVCSEKACAEYISAKIDALAVNSVH